MQSMGVFGLGAFGQLLVRHLAPYFDIKVCDPSPQAAAFAAAHNVNITSLAEAARARYVVLAVPVLQIAPTAKAIAPYVRKGAIVLDVGSVKLGPTQAMDAALPEHVRILGTHPLFGPQSARGGLAGLKLALCPVRGFGVPRLRRTLGFLQERLHLDAFESDAQSHDRDMAMVQGLTHLIAKVLDEMEPLPRRQTTLSFDYLVKAMQLVRGDSDALFKAIERENPYSADVRQTFFRLIDELRTSLERDDEN